MCASFVILPDLSLRNNPLKIVVQNPYDILSSMKCKYVDIWIRFSVNNELNCVCSSHRTIIWSQKTWNKAYSWTTFIVLLWYVILTMDSSSPHSLLINLKEQPEIWWLSVNNSRKLQPVPHTKLDVLSLYFYNFILSFLKLDICSPHSLPLYKMSNLTSESCGDFFVWIT